MVLLTTSAITPGRVRKYYWELVAGVALIAVLYKRWLDLKRPKKRKARTLQNSLEPKMDTRRLAALARGEAIDHTGAVVVQQDPDCVLDGTIFYSLTGKLQRELMRRQLARVPHWSDAVYQEVQTAAAKLPAAPSVPNALTDFMFSECDFKMEHADGSFMDHLTFCYHYSAVHYKARSPRVLLLHSIMGVGTNIFPMQASKIPKLAALLSPEEMAHIEIFPTFIRLLLVQNLLGELRARGSELSKLKGLKLHRVIDNKVVEVDAETFWVQLNYQLIHTLDFLPVAEWPDRVSEPMFQVFLELREFLVRAGQLQATVNLGSATGDMPQADELLAKGFRPWPRLKRRLTAKQIRKYSADVGHSLEYELKWQ